MESVIKNKSKLPEHSQFVRIDGGNHSQFGYYGFQLGDNGADIDRKQQHSETLKSIMEFIRKWMKPAANNVSYAIIAFGCSATTFIEKTVINNLNEYGSNEIFTFSSS